MEIAKGINSDKWHQLDLSTNESEDWKKAIEIFSKRIKDRYVEPIDILIDQEKDKKAIDRKFGFTILAIDCMLVETLQAFYEGLPNTKNISKKTFTNFLLKSENFKSDFTQKINGQSRADKFYYDFRCGILHQAETGEGGKIWSIGDMVWEYENELIINRTEFHERLKKEIEGYIDKIENGDDSELRKNFVKKMDYISKNPNPRYPEIKKQKKINSKKRKRRKKIS
jgi:hypothetical protein